MKHLWILLLLLAVFAVPARAEMDGDAVYTLYDGQGNELTMRAGRMFVGDEYISGDDRLYRVASVDDAQKTARAEYIGPATLDEAAATAFASPLPKGMTVMEPGRVISMVVGYIFSSGNTFIRRGESAAFSRQRYSALISLLPCMEDILRLSRGKPPYSTVSSTCSSAGIVTSSMASLYS